MSGVPEPDRPRPSRVGVFTAGYLALFAAWGAVRGDPRVIAYLVVASVVTLALRRAHRSVPFSARVCGALSVCGLLHMVGGILPAPVVGGGVFYDTWLVPGLLRYDQLVHFASSAVVTVALWQMCTHWCDPQRCSAAARAVLAVLAALGLGALNEGFEFLSSLRFTNHVGGLSNTGWDLVFNAFGAFTAGVFLVGSARPAPLLQASGSVQGQPERCQVTDQ